MENEYSKEAEVCPHKQTVFFTAPTQLFWCSTPLLHRRKHSYWKAHDSSLPSASDDDAHRKFHTFLVEFMFSCCPSQVILTFPFRIKHKHFNLSLSFLCSPIFLPMLSFPSIISICSGRIDFNKKVTIRSFLQCCFLEVWNTIKIWNYCLNNFQSFQFHFFS